MREAERYRELGSLTTSKDKWAENIPYVSSPLNHAGVKIQARRRRYGCLGKWALHIL